MTKKISTVFVLAGILVLLGAGCDKAPVSPTTNTGVEADGESEAAKNPQNEFNKTESVNLIGSTAALVKKEVEPQLNAVFGKIKPTLFSGNYLGQTGSFLVTFKVPKVITSDDFNKLVEEFVNSGYTSAMTSIAADSGNTLLEKGDVVISVSYENPEEQEIGVLYIDESKQ